MCGSPEADPGHNPKTATGNWEGSAQRGEERYSASFRETPFLEKKLLDVRRGSIEGSLALKCPIGMRRVASRTFVQRSIVAFTAPGFLCKEHGFCKGDERD